MKIEQRIEELGYQLPPVSVPAHPYRPVVVFNRTAYISGQVAKQNGAVMMSGRVPDEISVEEAQKCAVQSTLQALAYLKQEIGDLDRVERFLKVTGFVYSQPGFGEQPQVINACSRLLQEIFGEAGQHARSAIGMAALPTSTPVEIEMIVALRD
ncbi:MAG: RidA family protein [Oscillospiraceae bacterium]|nr:MAG: RidA family protein [Oscillospiraceae bacterium]